MDAAIWGFVGVVIGGIITGFFTNRGERIRAEKEAELDSAKRRDDRRLGRDNFQRETLLALQDAIGEVNAELIKYYLRHEGIVPDAGLPERYRAATGRVITLRSRVSDEAVREAAGNFIQAAGQMSGAKNSASAGAALERSGEHAREVLDRSGRLILATFVEPAAE